MELQELKQLEKSSQRSGLLSLTGIVIFISSLIYASISLNNTNDKLEKVSEELRFKEQTIDSLNIYQKKIIQDVTNLKDDEKKLTAFLIRLIKASARNSIGDINEKNWEHITNSIVNLPSGKRKTAVLISLLMTWKEIPFQLGGKSPSASFDSPGFLKYVIEQVDIQIDKNPNEFLSEAMMNKFEKVDKPLPGDFIFYRGQTGNFGLLYLCEGEVGGHGIAIGTLQSISPLAIYDTRYINIPFFPFRGYYRVNYEDYE